MFFTFCGRVVAVLAILAGVYAIGIGLWVATGGITPEEANLAGYMPSTRSSGQQIDRGIYRVLFGIVLGILTEISYTLRKTGNAAASANPSPRNLT